jgi:hypothetical protein
MRNPRRVWLDGGYGDDVIAGVPRGEWREGGMVGQGDA